MYSNGIVFPYLKTLFLNIYNINKLNLINNLFSNRLITKSSDREYSDRVQYSSIEGISYNIVLHLFIYIFYLFS